MPGAQRPAAGWGPNYSAPLGGCYGIWPTVGGQSTYANNCYGHDEPGINFYSDLPGSGGNVTWNVTLPTSAGGQGYAQSDLYSAIWFGLTFSDPYSWEDMCFLELQFYPDSSWTSSSAVYGNWVGAAVAWQIEAATGYEDPCFYQVLTVEGSSGSSYFNMNQGDQISVAMTGWVGDPYGENITITDVTSHTASLVNFYDYGQSIPLDPAYSQNTWANALQWTPGGELPAVFAFETGHTAYPYPNNNSYGGCSAGVPPPTASDPATPCPSYDPGSWVNDTLTPWKIAPPTFSNAATTVTPSQVSFTQDLGGIAFIDPISNGSCAGRDGSAWCSYPWYSYYCGEHAFEFGATDYPGVSDDFGGYDEYAQAAQQDTQQFGYYPPTNFSIPTCGAPAYTVTVSSAQPSDGAAYFLSQAYTASTRVTPVAPGTYALSAIARPGDSFQGWTTTGNVSVAAPADPDTSVLVAGNGSVAATFSTLSAPVTTVTFNDTPTTGHTVVVAGILYAVGNGVPIATLANDKSLSLSPGLYSIQAYPTSGYNFSSWSVHGDGASIAAPDFVVTWLDIPATAASVYVTATLVSSSSTDFVYYGTYYGTGKVSFNGGTATTFSYTSVNVGTYALDAIAGTGYEFGGWITGSSAVMTDFQASTNVTLENGTTYYLDAYFVRLPATLTLAASPVAGGGISLDGAPPVEGSSASYAPGYYTVSPVAAPGYSFTGWAVTSTADLWVYASGYGYYWLEVNSSATLTAKFSSASALNLTFAISPASAGTIEFAFQNYSDGAENTTLSAGLFPIAAIAAPGWALAGWTTVGGVSVPSYGGFVNVTAAGGALVATFEREKFTVTFLANAANGATFDVNGTIVPNGANTWVPSGGVPVSMTLPSGPTFRGWAGSPGESITGANATTLYASGPGTVTALVIGFSVVGSIQPKTTIDLGQSVIVSVAATGVGPFTYAWSDLPPGCSSGGATTFTCTPNGTGVYNVTVDVAGPGNESVLLVVGTLTVVPTLIVPGFTVSPGAITLGRSVTLSVGVQYGQTPYVIAFSGLPGGCNGANVTTFSCQPNGTGLFDLEAVVTDATGYTAYGSAILDVNPTPSITQFVANRTTVDVGLPARFADSVSGGTAPITVSYSGLPQGCTSANTTLLVCTPTDTGTFAVVATATDADGFSGNATLAFVVNPLPMITGFLASSSTATVNNTTVKFVVAISGGTAPYRIDYTGLPPGCFSTNSTQLSCYPRLTGHFNVTVEVTDSLGQSTSAVLALTVQNESTGTPGGGSTGSSSGWTMTDTLGVAAVVVLVAIGLVAALLVRRRRPPPTPELGAPAAIGSAPVLNRTPELPEGKP